MNQSEYLNQLDSYLKKLPKSDYENAMDYFTEYFEEAGEQRAIEELGTPKEAAAEILNNLLNQNSENGQAAGSYNTRSLRQTAAMAYMSILTTPYGLPAALGIIILTLVAVLVLSCIALAALICSMVLLWLGAKYLIRGFMALPHSRSGACMLAGTGILGIGLWLLVSVCTICVYHRIMHGIIQILQKFVRKKKGKAAAH